MRILELAVRYPPAPGGAETHVAAVSEGLRARGHDVTVWTSDLFKEVPFERDPALPVEVNGVPVRRFPAWTPGGDVHYVVLRGLTRALLREARDFDVIHAHSYGYHQTVAAALARRTRGTPFLFTPHFHPHWSMEGGARRSQLRWVYDRTVSRFVFRAADRVLCVSSGERDILIEENVGLIPERVAMVPNGIHEDRYRTIPDPGPFREAYGFTDDDVLLVYAGRLASNKGLVALVDALPAVLAWEPRARLVLAGEDQDQGPLIRARAAMLGLSDRVHITGHVPDGLYASALSTADVFVLPSEYEAFGIVLSEAMAAARPVVATRVGGAPEVVGGQAGATGVEVAEGGIMVPPNDSASLSEGILRVLDDKALARRLGDAGRARVLECFTWRAVVDRVEDEMRTLAA